MSTKVCVYVMTEDLLPVSLPMCYIMIILNALFLGTMFLQFEFWLYHLIATCL
jgi:hypothetical protein